jgi:hypothetical protein
MFRKSFSSFAAITLLLGASAFAGKKTPVPEEKNTNNLSAKQPQKRGADAQNSEGSAQPHPQQQVQKNDVEPSALLQIVENNDRKNNPFFLKNIPTIIMNQMNQIMNFINPRSFMYFGRPHRSNRNLQEPSNPLLQNIQSHNSAPTEQPQYQEKRSSDAQSSQDSVQPHLQQHVQKHDVEPSSTFNTDPSGSFSMKRNEPLQSDMNKSQTGTNPEKEAVSKVDASSQTLETVFLLAQKEVEQQEPLPQKELIKDGKETSSNLQIISSNNDKKKSCVLLKKIPGNLMNQIISFLDPRSVRKFVATNKAIRKHFETNPFVREAPTPLLRNILNCTDLPIGSYASNLLPSFIVHSQKIVLVENNFPIQPLQTRENALALREQKLDAALKKLGVTSNLQKQLTDSENRTRIENENYENLAKEYPENEEFMDSYDHQSYHFRRKYKTTSSKYSYIAAFAKKFSEESILCDNRISIAVPPHFLIDPNVYNKNPLIQIQYLKEFYPLCAMQNQLSKCGSLELWLDFGKYDLIHALPTISEIVKKKDQKLVILEVRVMRSAENLETGTVSNQMIVTPGMGWSTGRYTIPQMRDLKSLSILLNPKRPYDQEPLHADDLKASQLLIALLNNASVDLEELKIADFYAEPFKKNPALMENLQKAFNRLQNLKVLSVSGWKEFLTCVNNNNTCHQIKYLNLRANYRNCILYTPEHAQKYIKFLNGKYDLIQIDVEKICWPHDNNKFFEPLLNALSHQSNLQSFKCYITKPESLSLLNATLKKLSRIRHIEVECSFDSYEAPKSSDPEMLQLMQLLDQPNIEKRSLVITSL